MGVGIKSGGGRRQALTFRVFDQVEDTRVKDSLGVRLADIADRRIRQFLAKNTQFKFSAHEPRGHSAAELFQEISAGPAPSIAHLAKHRRSISASR